MRLEAMWVHGLRRFGGEVPVKLRLDSPIVCLIGANEVGKSTLLDALEMVTGKTDEDGEWVAVDPAEWTRGEKLEDDHVIVRQRYRLDDAERKLLRELAGGAQMKQVRWLDRYLRAGGTSFAWLEPTPVRDTGPRQALAETLVKTIESPRWPAAEQAEGTPAAQETMSALIDALESERWTIKDQLGALSALADHLEAEEWGEDLIAHVRELHEIESRQHPRYEGRDALEALIPRFVRFELADRQLADEYELRADAANPPPALHNLAELAELDLEALLEEIDAGITGSARQRLEVANTILVEKFSAWKQRPPVEVSFDRSNTQLLIHVKSGSGVPMKPRERSEGLRQFVALVALTAGEGHTVPPILLIDEVEMHLHYDAQADLMEVLSKQSNAAQVIYTTHSAACLPEDLGSSVRVVRGIKDEMRSEVDQQFWSDKPGLVSLLLAMGAGSMAFVALRPAAIVEGGSDLVLLPSLIKEAARITSLGYQVVPGAAEVPPSRVAGLDLEGVRTAWVLDGDKGGRERRKFLIKENVPAERVHLIKDGGVGIDLEDLVHPETYVKAVNAYVQDLNDLLEFPVSRLPDGACERHRTVEAWCESHGLKAPGKTTIANKVLELRGSEPMHDPKRRDCLRGLHRTLRGQLVKPKR